MDVLMGQLRYTRRHLRGLYLVIEQIKQRRREKRQSPSPLLSLVERMCLRLDFSICSVYRDDASFPSLDSSQEKEDRKWLTQASGVSKHMSMENVEWTLVSFELDNLSHRAYSMAKRSNDLRESGDPEAEDKIRVDYRVVLQGLELWKQRAIIRRQEEVERYARQVNQPFSDPALRFLYHEPLNVQNTYYAKLLNQWRMLCIWSSLSVHPFPGPEPMPHNRYSLAVDICKTHAALGKEANVGPSWQCLFYAGMALGGKKRYPLECEWIEERLQEVAMFFPSAKPVIDRIPTLWEKEKASWCGFSEFYESCGLLES